MLGVCGRRHCPPPNPRWPIRLAHLGAAMLDAMGCGSPYLRWTGLLKPRQLLPCVSGRERTQHRRHAHRRHRTAAGAGMVSGCRRPVFGERIRADTGELEHAGDVRRGELCKYYIYQGFPSEVFPIWGRELIANFAMFFFFLTCKLCYVPKRLWTEPFPLDGDGFGFYDSTRYLVSTGYYALHGTCLRQAVSTQVLNRSR